MPQKFYSEDYWFSKYGLYSQRATEILQWRLLIL